MMKSTFIASCISAMAISASLDSALGDFKDGIKSLQAEQSATDDLQMDIISLLVNKIQQLEDKIDSDIGTLDDKLGTLEDQQAGVYGMLAGLNGKVSSLEGQRITGDYFHTNEAALVLAAETDVVLHTFTVPSGEVLDFMANFTSHEASANNATSLYLY